MSSGGAALVGSFNKDAAYMYTYESLCLDQIAKASAMLWVLLLQQHKLKWQLKALADSVFGGCMVDSRWLNQGYLICSELTHLVYICDGLGVVMTELVCCYAKRRLCVCGWHKQMLRS